MSTSIPPREESARTKRKREARDALDARDERALLERRVRAALALAPSQRARCDEELLLAHASLADAVVATDARVARDRARAAARAAETHDAPDALEEKLKRLIDLVRRAASRDGGGVVIHTGAGVSTAAGVPDFRGPSGVWTMRDVGVDVAVPKFERVVPTKAHMAIAALVRAGVVKRVVTQNVDGLHARSGCDDDKVSRLHGCVYEETCVNERCEKFEFRVKRAFDVTAGKLSEGRMHRHRTGRACDACGEELRDTIVHFGERLHPPTLLAATRASADAALSVVVGTSLKVPPASTLPGKSRNRVICNLQWTRYDATAAMKIHARADEAMTRLCEGLGVEVPEYDARSDPVGAAFLASGGTFLLAGKKEEEEEEKEGGDASALAAGAGAGRGRAGAKKKKRRGRGSKPCVPRPTS